MSEILFKPNVGLILICCLIMTLTACSNNTDTVSHDGKNLNMNLTLPEALTVPPIAGLQAYVTLNGGSRTALKVNATDNTVSGQVSNVAVGSYQFRLVYFKDIGGIETVLASFSTSITVSKGQTTTVTVNSNQLDRNIDDDGDGYTNLAEVRLNTDPHNKYDPPAANLGFAVGNGSYASTTSTSYSMKSIVGETFNGTTTSTNFQVTAGFTRY